jgi:FkbH-like protein
MTDATEAAARRKRGIELQRESGRAPEARLTVLGSFNLDSIPPYLVEALDRAGFAAEVATATFAHITQELLNPGSELYGGDPRDVLLVPAAEDLLAPLFAHPRNDAEEQEELVETRLDELRTGIGALLERAPAATCYVTAFGPSRTPATNVLDPADPRRGQRAVERFLHGVRELGALSPRVVVVDWDWHVRALGAARTGDDRLWYLGRMRLNSLGLAALSDLVARHFAAFHGHARKVAVVDLDGTLWGGVVGELGLPGLELGDEGVGLAFRDFQRELLRLKETGVVLAVASKNNRDDAVEVFERHPGMVLALSDFAAERINWQDKASSLREIAAELGLGLDSFVFLDDNPVERDWIAQALPQVAVPELPADPADRPAFLRDAGLFDRLYLTEADLRRAESYAAQGTRSRLRAKSATLDDFLRSLEQRANIEPVGEASLARAAQLCQRTNQFNLTSRRHTMAEIEAMLASGTHEVYTLALTDRFGDSGVTGLAILSFVGEDAEIDTFLLSCRVLGRRVEDALLAFLAGRAADRGARRLIGRYVATAKNGQAATLYPDRGFRAAGDGEFHLYLSEDRLEMPSEIEIRVPADA